MTELKQLTVVSATDTCYILSFAIIMLNTSLHNPNVKDKPSLQRFVSMNRGINNGEDLPAELLTVSCYYQDVLSEHAQHNKLSEVLTERHSR